MLTATETTATKGRTAKTLKASLIAGLAAIGIAGTLAAPAQAFGSRERAFVQGAASAILIDRLIQQGRPAYRQPQYRYVEPGPVYVEPRPIYVEPRPVYVEPRPVYVEPRPVYVEPRPVYVQPDYGFYNSPAAQAFDEYTPATRRAIQAGLADYGYYRGGIDGQWGAGTWNAVLAYARSEGRGPQLESRGGAMRLYNSLLR